MKKVRLILVVCGLLLTIISSGQTTLTFRMANPRVVFISPNSYLRFDVQVKTNAVSSFLWSGQANVVFDNNVFYDVAGDWVASAGTILSGTYYDELSEANVTKYPVFEKTLTGNVFNIVWGANSGSGGKAATAEFFNEISSVNWITIATVTGKIKDPAAGVANIAFVQTSMNTQEFYHSAPSVNTNYIVAYDVECTDLYVGRIFNASTTPSPWTQVGGTLNWGADVNTSVWEGNATVTPADPADLALASNLRIHNPATLTIPATGKMTVSGNTDLKVPQGLTIQSTSNTVTGSLITGTATGAGSAVVNRFVFGAGTAWHLISSPVAGQGISTFLAEPLNSIAINPDNIRLALALYNNVTPAWVFYTIFTTVGPIFDPAKGYEVLRTVDGNLKFVGTLETGTVGIGLTSTGNGWNLIGNPYASAIRANGVPGGTNFLGENAAKLPAEYTYIAIYDYARNGGDGGYVYITPGINPAGYNGYVPLGQAFFVKVTAGETAGFTPGMRVHNSEAFKSVKDTWPSINVKASIEGSNKETQVYYIPGTTLGIDKGYDAGMFEDNPAIGLYTGIEGSEIGFAIQSVPDNDYENMVVAVGLNAAKGSTVIFSTEVTNLPVKVYLEDRLTGKFTRLDESGSSYTVVLNAASNGTGRFFMHTKQGVTGIEQEVLSDIKAIALPQQQIIRVLGALEPSTLATVYDMNGRVLVSVTLQNPTENEIPFMPLSSGIYMLKLQQTGTTPTSVKINWIY